MSENASTEISTLPGELEPLPMRYGGAPVSDAEALGVARRHARVARAQGRKLGAMGDTDRFPSDDEKLVGAAYRFSRADLFRARAKAEMEGRTLTEVLSEALAAYAESAPGSQVQYVVRSRPNG